MSSSAATQPQHLYYYIEQGSPERFGQELTAALNRISERGGDVLHISTQIMAGSDGTPRVWTGQIVFAVDAGLAAFAADRQDRSRDRASAVSDLFVTWKDAPVSR